MRAATLLALHGGDGDHQGDDGRIGLGPVAQGHREECRHRLGKVVAVACEAECRGSEGAHRRWIGRPRAGDRGWWPARPGGGGAGDAVGNVAGEHGDLDQRVAGQPVGAVEAGAGRLATGPQPFEGAAAGAIDGDAAHMIVRRRADRDQRPRRIVAGCLAERVDRRKADREGLSDQGAGVEIDPVPEGEMPRHRPGHAVARRKLRSRQVGEEASAGLIDQHRALAAERLADQPHRPDRRIEGGRVELDEFEIGEHRPGPGGERQALPDRASRIAAVGKEAANAARRHDDLPRGQEGDVVMMRRKQAHHRAILAHQAARRHVLYDGDRSGAADRVRHGPHELPAGAIAGRRDDAPPAVRGLQSEPEPAVRAAVETRAEPRQRLDRLGGGCGNVTDDGGIAQPVAGGERVGAMQVRPVVGAEACRNAALGQPARRFHPRAAPW